MTARAAASAWYRLGRPHIMRWARLFLPGVCLVAVGALLWRAGVRTPLPFRVEARTDGPNADTVVLRFPERYGQVVLSPDGRTLAWVALNYPPANRLSGRWDPVSGTLALWDVPERRLIRVVSLPGSELGAVFCNGGRTLALATLGVRPPDGATGAHTDATLWLFDARLGQLTRRAALPLPAGLHGQISASPDGRVLMWLADAEVGNGLATNLYQPSPSTGQCRHAVRLPGYAHVFSPDGRLLAVPQGYHGLREPALILYDAATWRVEQRLYSPVPSSDPKAIAFSGDARHVAAWCLPSPTSAVGVWDVTTGKRLAWVRRQDGYKVRAPILSSDGSSMLTGEWLVSLQGHRPRFTRIPELSRRSLMLQGVADADLALYGLSRQGVLELWDTRTGRRERSWQLGTSFTAVAWHPKSGLFVFTAADGTVRLKHLR